MGWRTGGVALSNGAQVANNLAPATTVTLRLNGTVNGDGSLGLTLADSYHRPYPLETLTYTVDATPPVSVTLAISAVTPGIISALGFAQDESPIGRFALSHGVPLPCTVVGRPGAYPICVDSR